MKVEELNEKQIGHKQAERLPNKSANFLGPIIFSKFSEFGSICICLVLLSKLYDVMNFSCIFTNI